MHVRAGANEQQKHHQEGLEVENGSHCDGENLLFVKGCLFVRCRI